MKILIATQAYLPFLERGGQVGTSGELARGLAARGHQVTVLTADLGHGRRLDLGEENPWGWRSSQTHLEIIYLRTALSFRAVTVNPSLPDFCRARLAEFDLVHIYGLYDLLGPAVAQFARSAGIPYFIEPMGMFRPMDRAIFLKKMWHRLLGRRMTRGAWRLIATADLEREDLIQSGVEPRRLLVRYNPVDFAEYRHLPPPGIFRKHWNIAPNQPLVLFLGRLIPRKGADLLIEAFAQAFPQEGILAVAGPEGSPGYLDRLRKVAARTGIMDRVRFTGALYGEEKRQALADADVFALPSAYENFANAVAEAMASGVPVVITDRCGIHSLVKDRAGLVVPRERDAIARGLVQLTKNRSLRNQLREGCRAVTEELGLEKAVAVLEGFYRDCLDRLPPRAGAGSTLESPSARRA